MRRVLGIQTDEVRRIITDPRLHTMTEAMTHMAKTIYSGTYNLLENLVHNPNDRVFQEVELEAMCNGLMDIITAALPVIFAIRGDRIRCNWSYHALLNALGLTDETIKAHFNIPVERVGQRWDWEPNERLANMVREALLLTAQRQVALNEGTALLASALVTNMAGGLTGMPRRGTQGRVVSQSNIPFYLEEMLSEYQSVDAAPQPAPSSQSPQSEHISVHSDHDSMPELESDDE
ncbi:protein TE41 [Testudinid alphaherpesvirus 3]|uniref:Protein TE41 n=1 Tax=Testudinid alphaherpesvirus 3 TaxID=2560801 RepID=A0A0K1R165_9ALPH|nr:protein TE41 [Testudinid alphaherpesvirus 3]AIU39311.1 protein TE41 [Testudinid alphaherpesvirus 3]AIU39421.1 protein TE41 [Testudinid alphaherpesvirus 3]AKI81697.1 protein TE41 [Testudinid alphaherpesvirus 3]AKI81800.1 protein TE41 [Testudinid alphaherpesvirus 3]AKV40667.1 hypothetical protein [Testudinid alphaherpesvirus 3]